MNTKLWELLTHFKNNKKLLVTVDPQNVLKMKFADNLWLPFLDQPQLDVVLFAIFSLTFTKIL